MSTYAHVELTYTRKGTWFITAPCGWHVELPGDCDPLDVRRMANRHRINCCRKARISVETLSGYRESKGAKIA